MTILNTTLGDPAGKAERILDNAIHAMTYPDLSYNEIASIMEDEAADGLAWGTDEEDILALDGYFYDSRGESSYGEIHFDTLTENALRYIGDHPYSPGNHSYSPE